MKRLIHYFILKDSLISLIALHEFLCCAEFIFESIMRITLKYLHRMYIIKFDVVYEI